MDLNVNQLVRDKQFIMSNLVKSPDNELITKRKCTILVPSYYFEVELGVDGQEPEVIGIFPIIMDNRYCLHAVLGTLVLTPTEVSEIKIDDVLYHVYEFEAGATVVRNYSVIMTDTNPYYVYRAFIARGKVPWYVKYDDLMMIFENTGKYNGITLGVSNALLELLGATIARDPKNLNKMYRSIITHTGGNQNPFWAGLNNVQLSTDDTVSRLLGSYMDDGINSALMHPSKSVGSLEEVLRT